MGRKIVYASICFVGHQQQEVQNPCFKWSILSITDDEDEAQAEGRQRLEWDHNIWANMKTTKASHKSVTCDVIKT